MKNKMNINSSRLIVVKIMILTFYFIIDSFPAIARSDINDDPEPSDTKYVALIVVIIVSVYLYFDIKYRKQYARKAIKAKEEASIAEEENRQRIKSIQKMIRDECELLIRINKETLVTLRSQYIYYDPFGREIKDDWYEKGIGYFLNTQVRPAVSEYDEDQFDIMFESLLYAVDTKVERYSRAKKRTVNYNDELSGVEYEVFCKNMLEKNGWGVILTKKTGDQGVDIIAKKENITIAVQCKKHSKPIGNKSVQEIFTGKTFYDIKYGGVISNKPFTDAAKKLAYKNNILLLHHNDISALETKIIEFYKISTDLKSLRLNN